MSESRIQLYIDEFDSDVEQAESVRVTAGETLALIMHAARHERAWLNDFSDETILISRDMYEVLLAYKRMAQENNSRAA